MYGKTIRLIRISKNLQMKSVYQGICSKTNAIKFEKGDRMLRADKFNDLLNNLMISMDEFIWIYNNYRLENNSYLRYMFVQQWKVNKDYKLIEYVNKLSKSKNKIDKLYSASFRILIAYKNHKPINTSDLCLLVNYFSDLSSWTLNDLKFFANNCYILPYNMLISLIDEALKVKDRYIHFKDSNIIIATLLSNCIERMINEGDVKNTLRLNSLLRDISNGVTMIGYRLMCEYYSAKVTFLFIDKSAGKKQLKRILDITEFTNYTQLFYEIKELLK
jgi:HTH-type transcriptional regulator, pheromone-responsive regulator